MLGIKRQSKRSQIEEVHCGGEAAVYATEIWRTVSALNAQSAFVVSAIGAIMGSSICVFAIVKGEILTTTFYYELLY